MKHLNHLKSRISCFLISECSREPPDCSAEPTVLLAGSGFFRSRNSPWASLVLTLCSRVDRRMGGAACSGPRRTWRR